MTREEYIEKAKELRVRASETEGWEVIELLYEATRYETFADMLRSKDHGMWRCIEIQKRRESEKKPDPIPKTRPPMRLDTTMGYKGRFSKPMHEGTHRYAKLNFK